MYKRHFIDKVALELRVAARKHGSAVNTDTAWGVVTGEGILGLTAADVRKAVRIAKDELIVNGEAHLIH